jgi:hypothetical protein
MSTVVVVHRSVIDELPPYCIHGESFCTYCGLGVWLGTETLAAVLAGALPLCVQCATEVIPRDAEKVHLTDHLRADGPHQEL